MFSPMVPIISLMVSATLAVPPGNLALASLSRSPFGGERRLGNARAMA